MTETQPDTADIPCELIPKFALFLFEARLPSGLIVRVNNYIDGLGARAQDHSGMLVGQIRCDPSSAQLKLDLHDTVPAEIGGMLAQMGHYDHYCCARRLGIRLPCPGCVDGVSHAE